MSREAMNFDFELDTIQLYFAVFLVCILTYFLIKLGSILWLMPRKKPPIIQEKCRCRHCSANTSPSQKWTLSKACTCPDNLPLLGQIRAKACTCPANGVFNQIRAKALPVRKATALWVERTKAWQSSICNESRDRIVRKLITSTLSTSSSHRKPMYSPMVSLIPMLEASLFKTANSKPEYYQLISEKMRLFRKDLKQRRLRRKQLQLLHLRRLPDPQMLLSPELLDFERLSRNEHTVVNIPVERKEWHESLPCRSRLYMVDELMMAMLPRSDFPFPLEWDLKQMMDHAEHVAKKVEGANFQMANSRGEYYQKMGESLVAKNKCRYPSDTDEEHLEDELAMVIVPPEEPEV